MYRGHPRIQDSCGTLKLDSISSLFKCDLSSKLEDDTVDWYVTLWITHDLVLSDRVVFAISVPFSVQNHMRICIFFQIEFMLYNNKKWHDDKKK